MSLTLTDTNGAILHPTLWHRYETTRESRNIIHILADGTPKVTRRSPAARTCRVRLLFDSEIASYVCELVHRDATGLLTISDPDTPTTFMQYVVEGKITRNQEPDHPGVWFVEIEALDLTPRRTLDQAAPFAETRRNRFAYPSLTIADGFREVRRNLIQDPRFTNVAFWGGTPAKTLLGGGRVRLTATGIQGNALVPAQAWFAGLAGKVSAGYLVTNDGSTLQSFRISAWNGAAYVHGPAVDIEPGATTLVAADGLDVPPGSPYFQPRLSGLTGGDLDVVVSAPIVDPYSVLRPYFDGATLPAGETPDLGLTPGWSGGPDASAPILTGVQAKSAPGVIVSSGYGRVLDGETGTITLAQETLVIVPELDGQTLTLAGDTLTTSAGDPIRITATGTVHLGPGRWKDLTIVAGAYDGPPILGNLPSDSVRRYRWLGTPGESVSVEETRQAAPGGAG